MPTTRTFTWQDINPNLKPAAGAAEHATLGQVDIMRWNDDGTATVRYMSGRQMRTFRKRVATADLSNVSFR